jgi:hypothetical protein
LRFGFAEPKKKKTELKMRGSFAEANASRIQTKQR